MITSADFAQPPDLSLATIADWYYLTPILNTANWAVAAGVLSCTSGSSICAVNKQLTNDELFTTHMRFTSGTVDLRIANRFLSNTSPNATYYWAGVTGTNFRIGKTVDGTFTTLASTAYTLSVNVWATFTLQIVGEDIDATIDDGTTSANLSTTDADIALGGTHFVRSGPTNSCAIECDEIYLARAV